MEILTKDRSRLFDDVDENIYDEAYKRLLVMRKANPAYRDDQLLMRLLCYEIADEGGPSR